MVAGGIDAVASVLAITIGAATMIAMIVCKITDIVILTLTVCYYF